MHRMTTQERPHWREQARALGFHYHTLDGQPYWDESAYYQFTLRQIEEDLEAPTEALHAMVLALIDEIIDDEHALDQLQIPLAFRDWIAASWHQQAPYLYGRMDLAYDGRPPAKLLELNYDTPTALYESGFFQWVWLQDKLDARELPPDTDQFNALQDYLEQALALLPKACMFHFASIRDHAEDGGTTAYLQDIALQAGHVGRYLAIEDIGLLDGQFYDPQGHVIERLFKLYPWEFLLAEPFAVALPSSQTQWIEPPWKLLASNKGLLALLWERYPHHPNLLPCFFEPSHPPPLAPGWVRKPLFSREGANIELTRHDGRRYRTPGPYQDSPTIRQALHLLPRFGQHYAVCGSWVVADRAAGLCIREDRSPITQDSSRFIPHVIRF